MRSKEKTSRIALIAVVCLSAACIVIGGYLYISSVRKSLVEQAISNVLTVTQQQQQAFDNFIARDRERIHSFAVNYASFNSTDENNIKNGLGSFSEVEAVYSVVNLDTGEFYNNKTMQTSRMNQEQLEIYRELSGSGVRDPYIGLYEADERFGYYECFTFADGVPGLFQKGYASGEVSKDFSLSFYNDNGFAYIVNRRGDILLRSVGGSVYQGINIFDMLGRNEANQERLASLIAALGRQESGTMFFSSAKEEYVYTYVPVENVEEWYLVSVVPAEAIMNEADQIINYSQLAILAVVAVVAVFSVFMVMMRASQCSIEKKEKEIEYQEELFNIFSTHLSKNTGDIYLMFGKTDGRAEYVSPNFEPILGISKPQSIWDLDFLTGAEENKEKEEIHRQIREMKADDSLKSIESEWVMPQTGLHKWFRANIYCISVQEKEKVIIYISDRTVEQEIQNTMSAALDMAQAANKAKSTSLSSISHDIRTPMNAIMGLLILLKNEAENPQAVLEYTQRIDAASQHLLGLINDVLDMNKIESGSVVLNISELSLAEIIREINMIIRPQARAKKQEFKILTSSFSCEHLLGDKTRICQILINVLSNAVKYTQEGGRIEMSVRELPRAAEKFSRIEFTIRDNGQGMTEEYQKVIFDPFTREHETGTNKVQGTGLGMSIAKNLVEVMGGTIQLHSTLGEGSTFVIRFELREQEKEIDPGFWEKCGVRRMLVADDDPEICENVLHAMADTGVTVDCITDGDQVIEKAQAARESGRPYDLFLLDWKMPKVDGLEVARRIRQNYSKKIPILLFTAYDWADIEQEALGIGVSHFLPKPFFMSNFKIVVERVMGSRNKGNAALTKSTDSVVKGKRILIVEDIEVNRLILEKILKANGAECGIAVNGQEALEKFEASEPGQYDIILMDVQMPVMDGYEATRRIRASAHPEAKTVPIIAMTANAFMDDVRAALDAGMDAHVSKPIVTDRLEAAIKKVLDEKGSRKGE